MVEAAEYSDTRITARCALEQNRDLFAVPGNLTNLEFQGTERSHQVLIKQGAKLVATWEEVWEDLPEEVRLTLPRPPRLNPKAIRPHLYSRTKGSLFTKSES